MAQSNRFFFLLFFLVIVKQSPLLSQISFGTITGAVVDVQSQQPLRDVIVKIQRTSAVAVTDATGSFTFPSVLVGTHTLEFIKDGYQTLILPHQVVGQAKVTLVLAELAKAAASEAAVFYIGGIEITANKELLPEKLATTTQIKSQDIEHIQATSLGDVLDLVPGVEMKNQPALKDASVAMIRDPRTSNALSSFGAKIIIDDIPITNNSNLQGGLLSGVYTGTGNGVDLREIPADNIQSVEVVRGIAPANHGDYVGGIINVKTKASAKPTHRLKGKNNPDTKELNFGGSLPVGRTGINYNLNWAYSEEDIRKDYDNTQRLAAQLSFKNKFFGAKLGMTNQFKYSTLFEEIRGNPVDPDSLESTNKGYRFIYGNQFDYRIDPISTIKSNLYINYRRVDSYKQIRRISDNRVVSTLIDEGTMIGIKQYGPYVYRYSTIGDEVTIGHELDWSRQFYTGPYFHEIKLGNELQYDDNFGAGKTFDLLKPSIPGDRPRSFDEVPGTLQHSVYFIDQITGKLWKEFSLDLGFRLERYNTARYDDIQFFKSKNGAFLNPRINFAYFLGKDTQLRIGYGKSSKSPSLNSIYSEPLYFDVLDIVPVYRGSETLLVLDSLVTTYIYDTSNPKLKGYQEEKIEISLDHRIGDIGLSLTGFYSQRDQEPINQVQPFFYSKYFRPNWPSADGEAVAVTYLDMYNKQINGGWTKFDGLEFALKTRQVKKLNMDFMVNATYHHVKSGAEGLSWGTVRSKYVIPIYPRGRNWTQKLLLTYQVNYISQPLGIWISLTAQQRAHYQTKSLGFSDSLAVAYYDGVTNQVIQIPESERLDPAYKKYRLTKNPIDYQAFDYLSKWVFNARVSKSLFNGAEISLFVNNFLDDRAVYEDPRQPGYYRTANPEIFYGIEFSMLMDNLLYRSAASE